MDCGGGPSVSGPEGRRSSTTLLRALLVVSAALFGLWALLWVLLFPWIVVGDADNGRLSHDFWVVWIPEVGLALVGSVICLMMLAISGRRSRGWRLLAPPTAVLLALGLVTALAGTR